MSEVTNRMLSRYNAAKIFGMMKQKKQNEETIESPVRLFGKNILSMHLENSTIISLNLNSSSKHIKPTSLQNKHDNQDHVFPFNAPLKLASATTSVGTKAD